MHTRSKERVQCQGLAETNGGAEWPATQHTNGCHNPAEGADNVGTQKHLLNDGADATPAPGRAKKHRTSRIAPTSTPAQKVSSDSDACLGNNNTSLREEGSTSPLVQTSTASVCTPPYSVTNGERASSSSTTKPENDENHESPFALDELPPLSRTPKKSATKKKPATKKKLATKKDMASRMSAKKQRKQPIYKAALTSSAITPANHCATELEVAWTSSPFKESNCSAYTPSKASTNGGEPETSSIAAPVRRRPRKGALVDRTSSPEATPNSSSSPKQRSTGFPYAPDAADATEVEEGPSSAAPPSSKRRFMRVRLHRTTSPMRDSASREDRPPLPRIAVVNSPSAKAAHKKVSNLPLEVVKRLEEIVELDEVEELERRTGLRGLDVVWGANLLVAFTQAAHALTDGDAESSSSANNAVGAPHGSNGNN